MAQAVKLMSEGTQGGGGAQPESKTPAWVDSLLGYPRRFRTFLHEVRIEIKQVTWPTKDDVKSTTVVVILTVFFFALFLFAVDFFAGMGVEKILSLFRK